MHFSTKPLPAERNVVAPDGSDVVRAIIVPAIMRIVGDYNWWAPRPLRRLQQRIGMGEPARDLVEEVA